MKHTSLKPLCVILSQTNHLLEWGHHFAYYPAKKHTLSHLNKQVILALKQLNEGNTGSFAGGIADCYRYILISVKKHMVEKYKFHNVANIRIPESCQSAGNPWNMTRKNPARGNSIQRITCTLRAQVTAFNQKPPLKICGGRSSVLNYFNLLNSITTTVIIRTTTKIPPIPLPIISRAINKLFHIKWSSFFCLLQQFTDTGWQVWLQVRPQ